MALARVDSILAFGILMGFSLYRLPPSWVINQSALTEEETRGEILARRGKGFEIVRFARDVWHNLMHVGFYITIGVLISAIVERTIPGAWLQGFFGRNSLWSLLLIALAGIPFYACGGGVLPVARELMQNGMGRGAALAFLFVGPATRITPLMALATVLRPLFIAAYIVSVIAFALLLGLVYRY